MNILVACPIKDRAWAIPHWYKGIDENSDAADLDVVALLSPSEDNTYDVLKDHNITVIYDNEPGRPVHEIDGHMWGVVGKFEYMARLRNRLVEYALEGDYDYFFSLDSDIVLPKFALSKMLYFSRTHPGVISPAVNMVVGGVAWNVMNWANPYHPGLANRDKPADPGKADVVMAAMLLDRSALVCRWEAHMAGEDIGFCLDAESHGVERWWMPDIRCQHLMSRV